MTLFMGLFTLGFYFVFVLDTPSALLIYFTHALGQNRVSIPG